MGYVSDRLCDNCNAPLRKHDYYDSDSTQYDNAMRITLGGGYGMFIESDSFGGPAGEIIFCHECSHKLCELFPGFDQHVLPHSSHSHAMDWVAEHPDHWGWDYTRREIQETP